MDKLLAGSIGKTPLEDLVDAGILVPGQKVRFCYRTADGRQQEFQALVRRGGIELDGDLMSVSFAAVQCIRQLGELKAINGWMAWRTEDDVFLGEHYRAYMDGVTPQTGTKRYSECFYQYPGTRDVVFVFGAGASYAEGAPLRTDILPMILDRPDRELRRSAAHQVVARFLRDNFVWDRELMVYPSFEEVFGFLDYFIQKNESLSRNYPPSVIVEIKEALIKLTHHAISSSTPAASRVYRLFWEAVNRHNHNVSVITLNYDTCIDDAFLHMFPRNMYLDYRLDLANYDYSDEVEARNWWVNPREPILCLEHMLPVAIKVIKLHGSLNWKYCSCCNQVLLTPFDKSIDLGLPAGPDASGQPGLAWPRCTRDGSEYHTLLVPPSHLKDLTHPVISSLFIEASRELRRARKVVFVGYSLPESDVHLRAILKKSLRPQTEVIVINPDSSPAMRFRYGAFSEKVELITHPFEELVQDESTWRGLLS